MSSSEPRDELHAEALYQLAENKASARPSGAALRVVDLDAEDTLNDLRLLSVAIRELERRAARRRELPPELFADAAWCILLDLFICEHQGFVIGLSTGFKRWHLSEATAVRYIAALIQANLVSRVHGVMLPAQVALQLTDYGRLALKRVLAAHA